MNLKKTVLGTATLTAGCALFLTLMTPPAGARGILKPPQSYFAGYSGNVSGGVTSVTATVTLPTITCGRKRSAVNVQVQITTAGEDMAGVSMSCIKQRHFQNTVSSYVPFVGANIVSPKTGSVSPMPEDTITMTLMCGSDSQSATLEDVTSGEMLASTYTGPPVEPCGDYTNVGSAAGKQFGLPEMDSLAWTSVSVNGGPLISPPLLATNWFRTFRKATLTTGGLTSGGTAFTETYAPPAR
ncbi:MAG: hypothetical protein WB565_14790 [Acidimicrobiales bacterium]